MSLAEASRLLNLTHLTFAMQIAILLTYFLIPTFTVLGFIAIIRRVSINKKLRNKHNKNNREQIKSNFESTSLGEIKDPVDKSRFETLDLSFDTNGKAIRKVGE